jgi:hypothetical protein
LGWRNLRATLPHGAMQGDANAVLRLFHTQFRSTSIMPVLDESKRLVFVVGRGFSMAEVMQTHMSAAVAVGFVAFVISGKREAAWIPLKLSSVP